MTEPSVISLRQRPIRHVEGGVISLSVDVRTRLAGEVGVVLRGELSQATAAQFRQAVADGLAAHPAQLVLDLYLLTFIDSSGLAALVSARSACDTTGCRLAVEGVSPALRRTLTMTGLIDYFNVTGSA